jgi:hypothetical protein
MAVLTDRLLHGLAIQVADQLPDEAKQRVSALLMTRSVMPDADVSDRMILANYIVTGLEAIPVPREDPYPYSSGDVCVLGPGVFADKGKRVINWAGENFYATDSPMLATAMEVTTAHPDDPGPTAPADELPIEELPEPEPAPREGEGWRGHGG